MVFNPVGFDGSVTEADWARMMPLAGTSVCVAGAGDWAPTLVSGVDRTVRVAAGVGWAHGIRVTNTADDTIALDSVPSGSRWDLVAVQLDWAANTSTLVKVNGTSTAALPAGRLTTPAVSFDIPIALVQVSSGVQIPTNLIDLRVYAQKVLTGKSLLAISDAPVGTEAVINGSRYRRNLVGASVETVQIDPPRTGSGSVAATFDANGRDSVPHGLGFRPKMVLPSPRLLSFDVHVVVAPGATALTSTHMALKAFHADGAPYEGSLSQIDFWATA